MIFLAAGGTGGHIFPAIATSEKFKNECIIITDSRFNKYGDRNIKLNIEYLPIFSSKNKLKFFISLIPSVIKSIKLIRKYKPKKIISFGGYPTIPMLIASILMRKSITLHEANTIVGRTNKFFFPFAENLNTGFPLVNFKKKYIFTGNPVTKDVVFSEYPKITDHINILIFGGSQAAKIFTEKIPDFLINFATTHNKKIKIVHQCKEDEVIELKSLYCNQNIECKVNHFFDDIINIIKDSHLIISRAGALSITEILTIGRPVILIPYPYATDNHQFYNAKFVEDNNMGILIEQINLNEENLINSINKIFKNLDFYLSNIAAFNNIENKQI
jgi:UDP-N-acetylglucosamine--N-acetylmuramyl-(pentapeptide) pyrophosphoryl-undecaprenol N-acetylglucosamine transferase